MIDRSCRSRRSQTFVAWLWYLAVVLGAMMLFGPGAIARHTRTLVVDAARPGLCGLNWSIAIFRSASTENDRESISSDTQLRTLQTANRSLQFRIALLEEELTRLRQQGQFPLRERHAAAHALIAHEAVPAVVLGGLNDPYGPPQTLLNLGRHAGLLGDELVLEGTGLLIDQGESLGLEPDQLVLDGMAVVGRVHRVAQWTSIVQPVTDPSFRAAARLVRRAPAGPVFGPRGVLVGDGEQCRLENVAASEAVNVGDAVYCDDPTIEQPLIFGYVSSTSLGPADPFWTVQVKPCVHGPLRSVAVLKSRFGPWRMAAEHPR